MTSTHCETETETVAAERAFIAAHGPITALNAESAPHTAEYDDGVCMYCGRPERLAR